MRKIKKRKGKVIQTITAWRYSCDDKPFEFIEEGKNYGELVVKEVLLKTKKLLTILSPSCPCGGGCKPQKIRIVVEEV